MNYEFIQAAHFKFKLYLLFCPVRNLMICYALFWFTYSIPLDSHTVWYCVNKPELSYPFYC